MKNNNIPVYFFFFFKKRRHKHVYHAVSLLADQRRAAKPQRCFLPAAGATTQRRQDATFCRLTVIHGFSFPKLKGERQCREDLRVLPCRWMRGTIWIVPLCKIPGLRLRVMVCSDTQGSFVGGQQRAAVQLCRRCDGFLWHRGNPPSKEEQAQPWCSIFNCISLLLLP